MEEMIKVSVVVCVFAFVIFLMFALDEEDCVRKTGFIGVIVSGILGILCALSLKIL